VLKDLESNALHANVALNVDRTLKTLGITWSIRDDKIYYSTHSIKVTERLTKRNILSEIAKIFDSLGLLGPIIPYAKKLMQDVWRCGVRCGTSPCHRAYTLNS